MYNLFIDSTSSANLRVSANDSNRDYERRSIGILRVHACVRVRGQNTVTSAKCVSLANKRSVRRSSRKQNVVRREESVALQKQKLLLFIHMSLAKWHMYERNKNDMRNIIEYNLPSDKEDISSV